MLHDVVQFSGKEFQVVLPLGQENRRPSLSEGLPNIDKDKSVALPIGFQPGIDFLDGGFAVGFRQSETRFSQDQAAGEGTFLCFPWRCSRIISSLTGIYAWWSQSLHLIRGNFRLPQSV